MLPAAVLCSALAGCGAKREAAAEPAQTLAAAETISLSNVVANQLAPLTLNGEDYLLLASEKRGLVLLDEDGSEAASLNSGKVERFALQAQGGNRWLVAAFEEDSGEIQLFALSAEGRRPQFAKLGATAASAPLEALCLSRQGGRAHLFAIDEEGLGSEYVVYPQVDTWAFSRVRPLYFGPQVSGCAVDDSQGQLLVAQPPLGIWSLNADAEADEERRTFAAAPAGEFGGLWIDSVARNLWLTVGDEVQAYTLDRPQSGPVFSRPLGDLEPVSAVIAGGALLAVGEESESVSRFTAELQQLASEAQAFRSKPEIPRIAARAQTRPVASRGDAADDPAIWVNPHNAEASLILGTDKKRGLNVYDLSGKLLQEFPVGRVNNVDLRPIEHPQFAAIAAATNRSKPGVNLFGITPAGGVESLGLRPLDLDDPYGLCMSQKGGKIFTWASDKEGGVYQSEILLGESPVDWQLQSRGKVQVESQVEGCVVDDARGTLFFAEEDRGVWRLDLAAFETGEGKPVLVAEVDGERLVDDVEGMGLYLNGEQSYLVVSSQGNNSYALLSRDGSEFVGHFRVDMNPAAGIDGASETDGLEVSSAALGADYPQGLLVVQDGRKRLPNGAQNFKLVSWADIADTLGLH